MSLRSSHGYGPPSPARSRQSCGNSPFYGDIAVLLVWAGSALTNAQLASIWAELNGERGYV